MDDTRLAWICYVCRKPVGDDEGYVTINLRDVRQYEADDEAWRTQVRAQNGGRLIVHGEAWATMPKPPRWKVLHSKCDPEPDSIDYYITVARIRSVADVLHWTSHLLEKRWFPVTGWQSILSTVSRQLDKVS